MSKPENKTLNANVLPIFGDKVRNAVQRMDGWFNSSTGLGTARDKLMQTGFERSATMKPEQLEALYSSDDMAARVCDVVPEEMLRQGFSIKVDDADPAKAAEIAKGVADAAEAINLTAKLTDGMVWGRVMGGGVLLLGVDDGAKLVEPVNREAIKTFDHINVMDRRYAHPIRFYTDPTKPKFGKPEIFLLTPQATTSAAAASALSGGSVEVHETRLVVFGGVRTSITTRNENSGWEQSVLQRMQTTLTQFGISWDGLAHMLQDASQGIFKMKDLMTVLASNESNLVLKRLALMDQTRGLSRALVLDADGEDFERQNFNWSGIDKPYELLMLRLAASARMPVSILMGQSPAGMNATGELDIRWFYDTIKSERTNKLVPEMRYVLELIMLAKDGPTGGELPESWALEFPPLWQMTPAEEAEIKKTTAETDALEIEWQIVTPTEVALSRHTADGWQPGTTIDRESREAMAQLESDATSMVANTPTLEGDEGDGAPEPLGAAETKLLDEMATAVQTGKRDLASAMALVVAAFPNIDPERAGAILGAENSREPEPVPPALGGPPAPDPELDDPAEPGA